APARRAARRSCADLDRVPVRAPLEHAVLETERVDALAAQEAYGVVGEHAVGAAAVGDDLSLLTQLVDGGRELVEGEVAGAGDVAGGVLLVRAYVEHQRF